VRREAEVPQDAEEAPSRHSPFIRSRSVYTAYHDARRNARAFADYSQYLSCFFRNAQPFGLYLKYDKSDIFS
jgi:hypothetical protein